MAEDLVVEVVHIEGLIDIEIGVTIEEVTIGEIAIEEALEIMAVMKEETGAQVAVVAGIEGIGGIEVMRGEGKF